MADQRIQHVLVKFLTEVDTKGVNASKGAFTDLDKQVDKIKNNIASVAKDNKSGLNQITEGFKRMVPAAREASDKISDLTENLAAQGEEAGFLGRAMSLLRTPYGAVAAAVSSLIVLPIISYFKNTGEGADKLKEVMSGLGSVSSRVTSIFGEIGKSILDLDFRGAIEGFSKLADLANLFNTYYEGVDLGKLKNSFEDFARISKRNLDELENQEKSIRNQIAETSDLNKKELLLLDLKSNQKKQDELRVSLAERNLEITKKELAIKYGETEQARDLTNEIKKQTEYLIYYQSKSSDPQFKRSAEITQQKINELQRQLEIELKKQKNGILGQTPEQINANTKLKGEEKDILFEAEKKLDDAKRKSLVNDKEYLVEQKRIQAERQRLAEEERRRHANEIKDLDKLGEKLDELAFKIRTNQNTDLFTKNPIQIENNIRALKKQITDLIAEANGVSDNAKTPEEKGLVLKLKAQLSATIKDLTNQVDELSKSFELSPIEFKIPYKLVPGKDGFDPKDVAESIGAQFINNEQNKIKVPVILDPNKLTPEEKQKLSEALDSAEAQVLSAQENAKGEQAAKEERRKRLKELSIDISNNAKEIADAVIQTQINRIDQEIQLEQDRISRLNEIAADGNAEQLRLEEERLERLANQREEFAKRLQAISAIEIGASVGSSIAQYVSLVVKESLFKDPIVAIAETLALIGAIASGVASIRKLSVQGFELGDEYVTETGRNKPGPSDTIPALLTPGERVVPSSLNAKLGGITNPELVNAVEAYRAPTIYQTKRFSSKSDDILLKQNKLIEENTKAIQDMRIHLDVDMDSYHVTQAKRQKGEARRKRLARTR